MHVNGVTAVANFGQRPFSYTPPTGFLPLNTYNLPAPTILAGNQYMDAKTYTGTGATQTITVDFASDFAWLKRRDGAGENVLLDILRLTGSLPNRLFSNSTAAESTTADGQNSFSSTGIVLDGSGSGGEVNTSGRTYVAWQWKANGAGVSNTQGTITSTVSANTTAGFSIVTWTGNGSTTATVGHGLGVAPKMIITKDRNSSADYWHVMHTSLSTNYNVFLNRTEAQLFPGDGTISTSPTSTTFGFATSGANVDAVNENAINVVAYCFSQVAGYSAFGSYVGNGSSDGPFIYTGFRPKFVMIKSSSNAGGWSVFDSSRDTYNQMNKDLEANSADAEYTPGYLKDFVSNGFKIRESNLGENGSGRTYIYMAFAENPFKISRAR
jgi:hypothetical protein